MTAAFHHDSSRASAAECQFFLHKRKQLSRAIDATEEDAQTLTACKGERGLSRSGAGVSGSV